MKILYSSDLHGYKTKYVKLLGVAVDQKVDAVVLGGDLLPTTIGGLVQEQRKFVPYFVNFASALEDFDINLFYIPGNDDLVIIDDILTDALTDSKNTFNIDKRLVDFGGLSFIGMSETKDYFNELKDRCRLDTKKSSPLDILQRGDAMFSIIKQEHYEDPDRYYNMCRVGVNEYLAQILPSLSTLEDILNSLYVEDWSKTILVTHTPPYGLGLDMARQKEQCGSRAVLEFIEKKQPFISLHGHIHESYNMTGLWENTVINTICIQPGQPFREVAYAIIDTDTYETRRYSE